MNIHMSELEPPTCPHTQPHSIDESERSKQSKQADEDQQGPSIGPGSSPSTRYVDMLLELDEIPRPYNILASAVTWLLLAGYIVLPVTFQSIRNSQVLSDGTGKAGKLVVKTVQNLSLLIIAAICCGIGVCGMVWLSWIRRTNYVWLINRIIL